MNKKLVYSFYLSEGTFCKEINDIHFKCLEKFAGIFDEANVTLLCDDINNKALIEIALQKFLFLPFKCHMTFSIKPNQEFRESYVFKTEVMDRLGNDDLVFFAHNKGITNVDHYDKEIIYKWVIGMYFYSLNFIDEVNYNLIQRQSISYGSFLTENPNDNMMSKNKWCYIGTFFWINSKKLKNYVYLNRIDIPQICDRYYDEYLLGNIYPRQFLAASHDNQYIINAEDYYHYAENYIHTIYGEAEDFYEFYNNIVNSL